MKKRAVETEPTDDGTTVHYEDGSSEFFPDMKIILNSQRSNSTQPSHMKPFDDETYTKEGGQVTDKDGDSSDSDDDEDLMAKLMQDYR